jgi:predicted amino acid-binding ACT domain protein
LSRIIKAGTNLRVLMGYRHPGDGTKAAIELYPMAGQKGIAAAAEAGLSASSIPTMLVEGDDRVGLAFAIARAIAGAGVNMTFFVAQVMGRKFSAVLGFETEADAKTAAPLIKKATASKKK